MSRLIDQLKRVRQTEPQPMGFMLGKAVSEKPRMPLIALIQSENKEILTAIPDSVSAVMVEVSKADDLETLDKICHSGEKIIGGTWLKVSGSGALKKAFSTACDFVVFPPATALNLIPKEKPGCILELDAALSEGFLRTVNDLPVEAVLIFGKDIESPLTLTRLMQVQRIAYMVSKPIIMCISVAYSEAEMQALWNAGISAAVVGLTDDKSLEKLADLCKTIEKLTPPASLKKDRIRPILPHLQAEPEPPEDDEEEEEEDE
jgi:hypothetical protein